MTVLFRYVRGLHIVEKVSKIFISTIVLIVLLFQVLHGALKTTLKTNRPILPEQSMKDIVLNIAEIYAMSFDLLQELEQRMKNWYVVMGIDQM